MVGLTVHRSVLASGDRETGVTIHEVTPELDAGPVLARATVAVNEGESAESLAARVLEQEHRLLTATLAELAARAPIDQDPSGPPGMRVMRVAMISSTTPTGRSLRSATRSRRAGSNAISPRMARSVISETFALRPT